VAADAQGHVYVRLARAAARQTQWRGGALYSSRVRAMKAKLSRANAGPCPKPSWRMPVLRMRAFADRSGAVYILFERLQMV